MAKAAMQPLPLCDGCTLSLPGEATEAPVACPQFGQNLASAETSVPQFVQCAIYSPSKQPSVAHDNKYFSRVSVEENEHVA
jgi:hypothetical protein